MKKIFKVFLLVCVMALAEANSLKPGFSAEVTQEIEFSGPTWHFGDPSEPTYMSPWLPPSSIGVRAQMGFRLAGNYIDLKCPIKVTLKYDPDKVIAGKYVSLKIKAAPMAPSSGYSFESGFGIYLPNTLQVGLVGFPGVPDDLLPWTDIDYNLWDLLGFVPKVGSMLAALKDQIGVNMDSSKGGGDNILPLGKTSNVEEYHDTRTLIDVTSAVLNDDVIKSKMITKVRSMLPSSLVTAAETALGQKKFKEYLGKGIDKIVGLASLKIEGDPAYAVKGQAIHLMLNFNVPGKTSGDMPITIEEKNKEQEIKIHIPYFATTQDRLMLKLTQVGYHFTLNQLLKFNITVPYPGRINVADINKTVTQTTISQDIPAAEGKLELAVKENTEVAGDFHVGMGCLSATAFCGTKLMPMKCSVTVNGPSGFTKTVQEPTFRYAHAIAVPGLTPNTSYTFDYYCIDEPQMNAYSRQGITGKTKLASSCNGVSEQDQIGNVSLTNVSAVPDKTSIAFTWNTNVLASTEIFLSASPDIRSNYISYIKKTGGITAGYFDDMSVSGERVLEKNHSITVPNLDPDTVYYYIVRSWTFKDNKPAENPSGDLRLGVIGQTQTLPAFLPVTVKVKAQSGGKGLAHIPVAIKKIGDLSFSGGADTDASGFTPAMSLPRGAQYQFAVENHPCYQDATSSTVSVGASQEGALSNVTLNLTRRPDPGGYVVDKNNNPISGATVTTLNQSMQATTNAQGYFTFSGISHSASYSIEKTGYLKGYGFGTVNSCGAFTTPKIVLNTALGTLNITVKDSKNKPIKNATVEVKWLNAAVWNNLANLTTDANGKAVFNYNFPCQSCSMNLYIKATPPAGTKTFSQHINQPLATGDVSNVTITCVKDDQKPKITINSVTQEAEGLAVNFSADETGRFQFEYTTPSNRTIVDPSGDSWPLVFGYIIKNLKLTEHGSYKIKIRVKDLQENISETTVTKAWNGPPPPFAFRLGGKTANTMTFTWQRTWPNEAEFGKYVLDLESPLQDVEISSYETISHKISNLSPGQLVCGGFRVLSKDGAVLYTFNEAGGQNPSRFCISTDTPGPSIASFRATPTTIDAGEIVKFEGRATSFRDDLTLNATITLTNKNQDGKTTTIYSQQFNQGLAEILHETVLDEPGVCNVLLTVSDEYGKTAERQIGLTVNDAPAASTVPVISLSFPSTCQPAQDCAGTLRLVTIPEKLTDPKVLIRWEGPDSDLETIAVDLGSLQPKSGSSDLTGEMAVSHVFKEADSYRLEFSLVGQVDGKDVVSNVINNKEVNVK